MGERLPLAVSFFNKSKGKTSPPRKCPIFGVLELKTRRNGEAVRKKGWGAAALHL